MLLLPSTKAFDSLEGGREGSWNPNRLSHFSEKSYAKGWQKDNQRMAIGWQKNRGKIWTPDCKAGLEGWRADSSRCKGGLILSDSEPF